MDKFAELIEKIKNHSLDNRKEAFSLYDSLCNILKEKYGPVDKDYDNNPTKRGKEWLDIHHIMEYKLDDISKRTNQAKGKLLFPVFSSMCTLDELKPYNVKDKLVYANKIEHFVLHYLIDSIRGKRVFSGGPNYLWDECIALDYYGFDKEYMIKLQNEKEKYYSLMSSEEITLLYKKLIDWKNWNLERCRRHWNTVNYMIRYLNEKQVSCVENKDKFFKLLNIVGYKLDEETQNKIITLPFKTRKIDWNGKPAIFIKKHLFDIDEKTALVFYIHDFLDKSFTVPRNVEKLAEGAFRCGRQLESITIPTTVKEMDRNVFTAECKGIRRESIWLDIGPLIPVLITEKRDEVVFEKTINGKCCPKLKTVIYKGSRAMWDDNFSNVQLDDITLICKK